MKKDLILVGGGGHCKACIDVVETEGKYSIAGIVDIKEKVGQKTLGYNIIASDENLVSLSKKYNNFFITVGFIKNYKIRENKYKELKSKNINIPIIFSPKATVSGFSKINAGTIIMHGAIVNSDAEIGENCIINTGAIVEHEAIVGFNTHVSTSAVINGQCKIGDNCFIGSNSVILNNITICNKVIIGAGSVVTKSICEPGTYVGSPAKRI